MYSAQASGVPTSQASQPFFYDPSAPYRAALQPPPPPPPPVDVSSSGQYPASNTYMVDGNSRIPQYYYTGQDESNSFPPNNSSTTLPFDPYSNVVDPYAPPGVVTSDPYTAAQYYPYNPPVMVPTTATAMAQPVYQQPATTLIQPVYQQPATAVLSAPTSTTYVPPTVTTLPPLERVQIGTRQPATTVTTVPVATTVPTSALNTNRQESDLSRLEVYHFTPKQNTQVPLVVYPAPVAQPAQQYYSYPYPWQDYQPYAYSSYNYPPNDYYNYDYGYNGYYPQNGYYPPYYANSSEPGRPFLPRILTRAMGSQTEKPPTKTRALSPMHSHSRAFNSDDYPLIHQRIMLNEPTDDPNRNSKPHHQRSIYSSPLPDCRCIHCQRERAKVLNYYSD